MPHLGAATNPWEDVDEPLANFQISEANSNSSLLNSQYSNFSSNSPKTLLKLEVTDPLSPDWIYPKPQSNTLRSINEESEEEKPLQSIWRFLGWCIQPTGSLSNATLTSSQNSRGFTTRWRIELKGLIPGELYRFAVQWHVIDCLPSPFSSLTSWKKFQKYQFKCRLYLKYWMCRQSSP